jgi:hypothetical protein
MHAQGGYLLKDKNPEYIKSAWSYKKRIATKCRVCGGNLLLPEESKNEMHNECKNNINDNMYMM